MGSSGWVFILLQLWGLQEAMSLSVQQWPPLVRVTQGEEILLSCGVKQTQAWERLRVEWVRDNVVFCHLFISNGSLNPGGCGSREQLSWWPPTNLSLRLGHVSLNDSGDYVCRATLEIPKLQEAEGNGTKVLVEEGGLQLKETSRPSGLLLMLLVAGCVVAALVVLGAVLWGLSRCRRESTCPGESHGRLGTWCYRPRVAEMGTVSSCQGRWGSGVTFDLCQVPPGNSFYSNVLYRPRETPHRPQARSKEDTARDHRVQAIYSTTFPKPAPRHQLPVSKHSPRPSHPHCASSRSKP
ncbi:transmembrane and immunoglobulin domain-containing protein 2 [Phodopus roborovskii]|uniref:transmembrane and immunoglobulin domain-containing protein 2 n=1 Tax=Phodopus roborovskii TaxID=109678 RepID=UPI0021E3A55C|nr:transmembrane and immunoglobulin domain-containing protein 2 [Phodopus roborovskii]